MNAISIQESGRDMWTVGIETSGRDGSVALIRDDVLVVERSLSLEGRRHARTLVHELKLMLQDGGVSPKECDLIAVSQGPGSFTGLRVGVVCAKTWAYATGCRLVGVDTLMAIASSVSIRDGRVQVIADAQRGDLFHGVYAISEIGEVSASSAVRIVAVDDWIRESAAGCAVTGPAVEQIRDRIPEETEILPGSTWMPSAICVARVGRKLASITADSGPWSLNPVYLRKSAAEEKAELEGQEG